MLAFLTAILTAAAQADKPPAPAAPQGEPFESADYGIRLNIPPGWTIDASREPRIILRLKRAGDFPVKPELLIFEVRPPEPVTLSQHKESVRQFIQRAYREPRILDDRPISISGKPGFLFTLTSRGTNEVTALLYRGVVQLSAYRLIAVDGIFPQAQADTLSRAYEDLLARIQFLPRRIPTGAEEGLKALADLAPKLKPWAAADARLDEMEIVANEKVVGTYTLSMNAGKRGAVTGVTLESTYTVDLGEQQGKVETRVFGFLSDDLAVQSVTFEEVKTDKERRTQSFSATAALAGGEVVSAHTINGEKNSVKIKTPDRTIFYELLPALQVRLLSHPKSTLFVPVVSAFENEVGHSKLETSGSIKIKEADREFDGQASALLRDDGALMTSIFDAKRTLLRVSVSGQPFVLRRKK
jgi:hypothetical protein